MVHDRIGTALILWLCGAFRVAEVSSSRSLRNGNFNEPSSAASNETFSHRRYQGSFWDDVAVRRRNVRRRARDKKAILEKKIRAKKPKKRARPLERAKRPKRKPRVANTTPFATTSKPSNTFQYAQVTGPVITKTATTTTTTTTKMATTTTTTTTTRTTTTRPEQVFAQFSRNTGQTCNEDTNCRSGTCVNNCCYASQSCEALHHAPGQEFDEGTVNLVFVGSGFTSLSELRAQARNTAKAFQDIEVFDSAKNQLFTMMLSTERHPKFCDFGCAGIDRLLCCDIGIAKALAKKCFLGGANMQTIVIHNDKKYGGAGYASSEMATTSIHPSAPKVCVHEVGHSLLDLADEYTYGRGTANGSPNCDYAGCAKWSDLIDAGFDGVECKHGSCSGGNYCAPGRTFMLSLTASVGHVNKRYACCAFRAICGSFPSPLCDDYDSNGLDLLEYCMKDYQGFGVENYVHDDDRHLLPALIEGGKGKLVRIVDGGEHVKVTLVAKGLDFKVRWIDAVEGTAFRTNELKGDFKDLLEAANNQMDSAVKIKVQCPNNESQVLYMNNHQQVKSPPVLDDGGGIVTDYDPRVGGDTTIRPDSFSIVIRRNCKVVYARTVSTDSVF